MLEVHKQFSTNTNVPLLTISDEADHNLKPKEEKKKQFKAKPLTLIRDVSFAD